MKIDLKKYMTDRDVARESHKDPGPLLTLSRAYGCDANDITMRLLSKINAHLESQSVNACHWRYISKEIIEETAHELKLTPERLEHRVVHHGAGTFDDVFSSFSNRYSLSDKKIIDTIKEIVQTYASNGRVIIIGRGGAALTRDISKAIHVRLYAPLDWRSRHVAEKKGLSQLEAEGLVRSIDHDRQLWIENLVDKPFDTSFFDLMLNRSRLTTNEIVNTIYSLMLQRKLI